MARTKFYILILLQPLVCWCVLAQNKSQQSGHIQTSVEQAANVTISEYVQDDRAKRDQRNLDELMQAMMLAGLLPDETEDPADLGDAEGDGSDQNANRRNQRDRRRRNEQRRRNNRNRNQRNDDSNRTRTRYNRNQRRIEDAPPTGPVV